MDERCLSGLTAVEQREFALIVDNGRSAGWIAPDDELIAARFAQEVIVTRSVASGPVRTKSYVNRERWLLDLLHDLAHGMWRAAGQQAAACTELTARSPARV